MLEIFYWSDYLGKEVDFVIKEGKRIKALIQVCANPEEFRVKKREVDSLVKAAKELKCKSLLVITEDYEKEEKIKKQKIVFKPWWQWAIER